MSKYRVFSGPYFPVFGLSTERERQRARERKRERERERERECVIDSLSNS